MKFNSRRTKSAKRSGSARRSRWSFGPLVEVLESRQLLSASPAPTSAWHNVANPRDVNQDQRVSPLDALVLINDLAAHGAHTVPMSAVPLAAVAAGGAAGTTKLLDVNGDSLVSPLDLINVINALAIPKQVLIHTFATDLAGNPITTIAAGNDFRLQAEVKDVRDPVATFKGVFAAYMNVNYSSSLASIDNNATINYDPFFNLARTGSLTTPGQVNGIGASASSSTPPGNATQKLWNVVVHAVNGGTVTFTPSFDSTPGHDTALYGIDSAIPLDNIDFQGGSLLVTSTPTVSINDVAQAEGSSGGVTNFVFTVSLNSAATSQVTVGFNAAGVTAGIPSDFASTAGTLTFAPGITQQFITVPVVADTDFESDETFNVNLLPPVANAVLGKSLGLGTIQNDDVQPGTQTLSINDVTLAEGNAGPTNFVFTVTMSAPSTQQVTVIFNATGVTAAIPADFASATGTLTFAPGVTTRFITVAVVGDTDVEPDETFNVVLIPPATGATILDNLGVGTITNDDIVPGTQTLSINNVSLAERNLGFTPFVFTVTMSAPSATPVTVPFNTVGVTAASPADFAVASGTITFSPGTTTQSITVNVVGETAVEPDETFNVTLIPPATGAVIANGTGVGTILNDDGAPTLNIGDSTIISNPTQIVNGVFNVTLSAVVDTPITVSYATADDTAISGIDYTPQTGILTFTPGGPLTQQITVPVLAHPTPGSDRTFFVNLSSASAGVIIGDSQAVGTIVSRGVSISPVSVVEGNAGTTSAIFSVTLSQAQATQVTVQYNTLDGTATTADSDYIATSGTITFAAGDVTPKLITVQVNGDTKVEANETFSVVLSNAVGTNLFASSATGTIVNDDGAKVEIKLQLTDTNGVPIAPGTVLTVNDAFMLQGLVRDTQAVPTGVFQAYLDAVYDQNLVMITGPISFGVNFPNGQAGSTTTLGLIDEVGAFSGLAPPALPGDAQLLFSLPMKAIDVGLANFTPSSADLASHEILQYTSNTPVPESAVSFVGTSLNIGDNVISAANVTKTEGDAGQSNLVFTVTRFLATASPATVQYATSNGTATAGSDYVAVSGTLTFAVGVNTQTVTVPIIGDTVDELNETFFLNFSNASGANASQSPGVATIIDDDGPVSASIADASADEGAPVSFVVSLSQASGVAVTIPFATLASTSGNPATAGLDYPITTGTLTFAPGVTQRTITVQALSDGLVEPTETFQVQLSSPVNATLTRAVAQGSILDIPPTIITGVVYNDLNNDGVRAGNEVGIPNVTITAIRASDGAMFTTATTANGTWTFAGLAPGTYDVRETQPVFYNDGKDTRLGVESPTNDQFSGIVLAASQQVDSFQFGEAGLKPEFIGTSFDRRAFFSSSAVTGQYGPPIETFNLAQGDVWIAFDEGWQGAKLLQASFQASQGSATMTLYDANVRPLASSAAASGGAAITYGTDSASPYMLKLSGSNPAVEIALSDAVSVSSVSQAEGSNGTTSFVFTVSLSGVQSQSVTVQYFTSEGSALAGSDFIAKSGTLTFAPGMTTQNVTIAVAGDTIVEAAEHFYLNLTSPTNIKLGQSQGVGTITNDDYSAGNPASRFSSVSPAAATDQALAQGDDWLH